MLSIGTFSRLGHISVRMLRHYDAIGLLRPARVDPETGYRYYAWEQLETLSTIQILKEYRFPLATIGELLALDKSALTARLHEKRLALYRELALLEGTARRLDQRLSRTEDEPMGTEQNYQVILMETQPQQIFGISRHIHVGQIHDLFQDLHQEMQKRGLRPAGAGLFIYHGEEFSYDDMDVEAAFPIAEAHPDARTLPGGPHVSTIHIGPYEGLPHAYDAIGKWMSEHPDYEVAGPAFERYIKDEEEGVPLEEYETGILFPVQKVEKG